MDNEFFLDIEEILRTVGSAEVFTISFVVVNPRLLVDTRYTEIDGPLIKLVPKASSAEERFRSLKELRPRFKLPEKISAIWWPKFVTTLESKGIWDCIVQRVACSNFPNMEERCREVYRELVQLERAETLNAITGAGYQALWERKS